MGYLKEPNGVALSVEKQTLTSQIEENYGGNLTVTNFIL